MQPIRAACYEDLLLGVEKAPTKTISMQDSNSTVDKLNPEYDLWVSHDQALLGYLLSPLTHAVLMGVTTLTSSAAV
jgi:hypothetical protein